MSGKHTNRQFDQVVLVSVPKKLEQKIAPALEASLGEIDLLHLESAELSNGLPDLSRSLVVVPHGLDNTDGVAIIEGLRQREVRSPVLLLAADPNGLAAETVAGLGSVTAFPATGFKKDALENCLRAFEGPGEALSNDSDGEAEVAAKAEGAKAKGVAEVESEAATEGKKKQRSEPTMDLELKGLQEVDDEEEMYLKEIETLRVRRKKEMKTLERDLQGLQRKLKGVEKRLASSQEALGVEKRQRWEVVLDLRESQERVTEVEERLKSARDAESENQKELDALQLEQKKRENEVASITKQRAAVEKKLEQALSRFERDKEKASGQVEALTAELAAASSTEESSKAAAAEGLTKVNEELEAARRELDDQCEELAGFRDAKDLHEEELADLEKSLREAKNETAKNAATFEKEAQELRVRLEAAAQKSEGRLAELDATLSDTQKELAARIDEVELFVEEREKVADQLKSVQKESDDSQAWAAELETETERLRSEVEASSQEGASRIAEVRGELESAGAAKLAAAEKDLLAARGQLEGALEERVRADKLQKQVDSLLAELADHEEEAARVKGGRDAAEVELEELRSSVASAREEVLAHVAELKEQRAESKRAAREAQEKSETLTRQVSSMKAKVVDLEVAREEDSERVRDVAPAAGAAAPISGSDEIAAERDRLKTELDALRIDAENTRRALADSDARLRKLQQETTSAAVDAKSGDAAIQQLRAELGSLGD